MKCCDIHSGLLRSRITIQSKTRTSDGQGGVTDTWSAGDSVRAMWKSMSGGEQWHSMRLEPKNRVRVVIRFRGDADGNPYYSSKDRIIHRNRTYSIESVIDVEDRKKWLELIIVEGAAS